MESITNRNTLIASLLLAFIISSCTIDNYDGPDASFYGGIIDEQTGDLVETDLLNGSTIRAFEHGYENPAAQTWVVKNSGEFRNDMVFAATYDLELINGNFYPLSVENFEIRSGDNEHNFMVTPYIRVLNASISQVGDEIVATFSLEAGDPEVRLRDISLFAFTDKHVGSQIHFSTSGDNFDQSFNPSIEIDSNTNYTLSIELGENSDDFEYNRNYYFRVGALADVSGVGTVRYNYAPFEVIEL